MILMILTVTETALKSEEEISDDMRDLGDQAGTQEILENPQDDEKRKSSAKIIESKEDEETNGDLEETESADAGNGSPRMLNLASVEEEKVETESNISPEEGHQESGLNDENPSQPLDSSQGGEKCGDSNMSVDPKVEENQTVKEENKEKDDLVDEATSNTNNTPKMESENTVRWKETDDNKDASETEREIVKTSEDKTVENNLGLQNSPKDGLLEEEGKTDNSDDDLEKKTDQKVSENPSDLLNSSEENSNQKEAESTSSEVIDEKTETGSDNPCNQQQNENEDSEVTDKDIKLIVNNSKEIEKESTKTKDDDDVIDECSSDQIKSATTKEDSNKAIENIEAQDTEDSGPIEEKKEIIETKDKVEVTESEGNIPAAREDSEMSGKVEHSK